MKKYHISKNGKNLGEFTGREVKEMLKNEEISESDMCWTPEMSGWTPIDQIFTLSPQAAGQNQPTPENPHSTYHKPLNMPQVDNKPVKLDFAPYAGAYALSAVFLIGYEIATFGSSSDEFTVGDFLSIFALLINSITWAVYHYQCWSALPIKHQFTTPGRAVGYVFIPFLNLYWAFVTWPKLADGLLAWQQEKNASPIIDLRGPMIAYAIVFVLNFVSAFIPEISVLCIVADLVLFFIIYKNVGPIVDRMSQG